MKPIFIVLEGVDGSGKTTQLNLIKEILNKNAIKEQIQIILLQEPGTTEFGLKVRKILLESADSLDSVTQLLLFNASRRELIKQYLDIDYDKPTLILCDRYYYSTIAYQGIAQGIDLEAINELHKIITDQNNPDFTPDHLIVLDLDKAVWEQRKMQRNKKSKTKKDSFEKNTDWQNKVYDFYHNICETKSGIIPNLLPIILSANTSIEVLKRRLLFIILTSIQQKYKIDLSQMFNPDILSELDNTQRNFYTNTFFK